MQIERDNITLCVDCMIAAVNDDYTAMTGEQAERTRIGLAKLGAHLVLDFDSNTGDGIDEFSSRTCAACGTSLAGHRYRFATLTQNTRDTNPRYAPKEVLIAGHGMQPVIKYIAHSPNTHPKSPIKNEMTALELVTAAGSRWYGCDRAYINSELRMVAIGCDSRDEVRTRWEIAEIERANGRPENLPKRLENGQLPAYAFPGGYPIIYFARDNGVLCAKCANAFNPGRDNAEQLEPIAYDIHYEGSAEHCENCNAVIESAYGDPDEGANEQ